MKAILLISVFALIYIPVLLYFKFDWFKYFYHDVLGWHRPIESQDYDGCSFTSKCKHCGKDIMQDGQGDWF